MEEIDRIARSMLNRYSTPKVALEMAWLHSQDHMPHSEHAKHWQAVAGRIQYLIKSGWKK